MAGSFCCSASGVADLLVPPWVSPVWSAMVVVEVLGLSRLRTVGDAGGDAVAFSGTQTCRRPNTVDVVEKDRAWLADTAWVVRVACLLCNWSRVNSTLYPVTCKSCNELTPLCEQPCLSPLPMDMDCSPLSPILFSDVDMDILTDSSPTPPSYYHTPLNAILSVPPLHYKTLSVWKTFSQEQPTTWHSSEFAVPTMLYSPSFNAGTHTHWAAARRDNFASVASKPPVDWKPHTYHPWPFDATKDRIQDTSEAHWQGRPHHADIPHSASVATLVDEFERSLTLVIPSSGTDPIYRQRATSVRILPDHPVCPPPPQRESVGESIEPTLHLDNTPPPRFERESTAPLEQGNGQPSPPFEREEAEPFEQDKYRTCFPDLADQPRPLLDTASPTYTFPEPHAIPRAAPHVRPRPPTPPPSRRPSKSTYRSTDTTCHRAITTTINLAELPVAQVSVQASKRKQLQPNLGAGRALRQPSRCPQVLGDDGLELYGSGSGWEMPSSPKTALGLVLRSPTAARCSRRRRKVKVEEEEGGQYSPERRARLKQTRFAVPDPEDEGGESGRASPPERPRWTVTRASDSTRPMRGPGPLRSILRNKPAPYDKATTRHVERRATVP